jgi:DeoR/GlpR family transcriptional regulator of sugar metabolism
MTKTTRETILQIIKEKKIVTAKELSDSTNLTVRQAHDRLRVYELQKKIVRLKHGHYGLSESDKKYLPTEKPKKQIQDKYNLNITFQCMQNMIKQAVSTKPKELL